MSSQPQKTICLKPSWKAFFWQYFFSAITIPFIIGIFTFWRTWKNHHSHVYEVSDSSISFKVKGSSEKIDLASIKTVSVKKRILGVGDILFQTNVRELRLIGLENAEIIASSIEQAVEQILLSRKKSESVSPEIPTYGAGEMDRMDYLTGLWQQGLISQEDYEAEKKKFTSG